MADYSRQFEKQPPSTSFVAVNQDADVVQHSKDVQGYRQAARKIVTNGLKVKLSKDASPGFILSYALPPPLENCVPVNWMPLVTDDVESHIMQEKHIRCHELHKGDELSMLVANLEEQQAEALILINTQNNYSIAPQFLEGIRTSSLPIVLLTQSDGSTLLKQCLDWHGKNVLASLDAESADADQPHGASSQTQAKKSPSASKKKTDNGGSFPEKFLHALSNLMTSSASLKDEFQKLMFSQDKDPVVMSDDPEKLKNMMMVISNFKEKANDTDVRDAVESIELHFNRLLTRDFPFYVVLAHCLYVQFKCQDIKQFIIIWLDKIEHLPQKELAQTFNSFLKRANFKVVYEGKDVNVLSLMDTACSSLMETSYMLKTSTTTWQAGTENRLHARFCYIRMMWITLVLKVRSVRTSCSVSSSKLWEDKFISYHSLIHDLNESVLSDIHAGLELGNCIELPGEFSFNYKLMRRFIASDKAIRPFKHLKQFFDSMVNYLGLEDDILTTLSAIRGGYRQKMKEPDFSLTTVTKTTLVNTITEAVDFLDFLLVLWERCKYKEENIHKECGCWIELLLDNVDITENNVASLLKILLVENPAYKRHHESISVQIMNKTRQRIEKLELHQFFALYKAFSFWHSKFLKECLNKCNIPAKTTINEGVCKDVISEVVFNFPGSCGHYFLKDFINNVFVRYKLDGVIDKFFLDLLKLGESKLFSVSSETDFIEQSEEIRKDFAAQLRKYIHEYGLIQSILIQMSEILDLVHEEDEFQQLILGVLHQEIIPGFKTLQELETTTEPTGRNYKDVLKQVIDFLVKDLKWLDTLSAKAAFCWGFIASCCSCVCISSQFFTWLGDYSYVIFELCRIFEGYSIRRELDGSQSVIVDGIPEDVSSTASNDIKVYFQWIHDIQSAIKSWKEKLELRDVNYNEVGAYSSKLPKLEKLCNILCSSTLLVSVQTVETMERCWLEGFKSLNGFLVIPIPQHSDTKWCSFLALIKEYGVTLPQQQLVMIEKHVVFPDDTSKTTDELLHFQPGDDNVYLQFTKDFLLKGLTYLVNELQSFRQPFIPYLEMLVFFKINHSVMFQTYLRAQIEEVVTLERSQNFSQCGVSLTPGPLVASSWGSKQSAAKPVSQGVSKVNLIDSLEKTQQLLRDILNGEATYASITASGKLDLDKLNVYRELETLKSYSVQLQEDSKGLAGVQSLFELFQYTGRIQTIYDVCKQYQLLGCLNDQELQETRDLVDDMKLEDNRSKLTPNEASGRMKRVKRLLCINRAEDPETPTKQDSVNGTILHTETLIKQRVDSLELFHTVANSAEFYQFIREKHFYGEKGQATFRQHFQLITAQLQHEDYNEAVLNHLSAAFKVMTPFMNSNQCFRELMTEVTNLDTTFRLKELETVNRNITLIHKWFSRVEGDTLQSIAQQLDEILETGFYSFKLSVDGEVQLCLEYTPSTNQTSSVDLKEGSYDETPNGQTLLSAKPNCSDTGMVSEQEKWNSEQIGDFVRKLGFMDTEKEGGKKIKHFRHLSTTADYLMELYCQLRALGNSEYFKDTMPLLSCSTDSSYADNRVRETEATLESWRNHVTELRSQYNWLLFFSIPKILRLYDLLSTGDDPEVLDKIVDEISILGHNDQPTRHRLKESVQRTLNGSNKDIGQGESYINVVGRFLSTLFENHQLPKRSNSCVTTHDVDVTASTWSCQLTQVLHFCPGYTQSQLIQTVIEICSGVPEAFEVFRCQPSTTEEELNLFVKRVAHHSLHSFVLEVNRLSFKLQEELMQLHYLVRATKDKEHSSSELTSKAYPCIHFIETEPSVLRDAPWIKHREHTEPNLSFEKAQEICKTQVILAIDHTHIELVLGAAGNGKTHYIKEQLATSSAQLTIAVNEAFTPLKAISKLATLPNNRRGVGIFFNFTMLPPGDSVDESECERFKQLMEVIGWFFFDLLILGYVEDPATGKSFRIPGGLEWAIYVEVPFREKDMSSGETIKQFHEEIPTLSLLGAITTIRGEIPYTVDDEVQLVCKYLQAYYTREIDTLYSSKHGRKGVNFSRKADLSAEQCQHLLHMYMPEHIRKTKITQKLFVKYMKRRCEFLDKFPAFNFNTGRGEYTQGRSVLTNTQKLGSTLMTTMLREVSSFCDPAIKANWSTEPHQQLIYDYKDCGASLGLVSLHPERLDRDDKERLQKIGIIIPSMVELKTREFLDDYLSRALNIQLENKRLKVIDDSAYVLTLDYTIKMLNIHERYECGVPVIIEGETGVGKTALIEMLSKLWNQSLLLEWEKQRDRIVDLFRRRIGDLSEDTINYAECVISIEHLSFGQYVSEDSLHLLCQLPTSNSTLLYSKVLTIVEPIRNEPVLAHLTLDGFPCKEEVERLFISARQENTPEATAKLLHAVFSAKIKPTFHKLNVHAAMTPSDIDKYFQPIFEQAKELKDSFQKTKDRVEGIDCSTNMTSSGNKKEKFLHRLPFVTVFLDEVNTSSCVGLFKEIIVDRTFDGEPIPENVFIIAACNPHRGNSMASLGIQGGLEKDKEEWMRGTYYVRKLHPTLRFLMWDYGSLDEHQEKEYINAKMRMLNKDMSNPEVVCLTDLIIGSQNQIRCYAKEQIRKCIQGSDTSVDKFSEVSSHSCVSQRDIQRVLTFYQLFFNIYDKLKPHGERLDYSRRALLVALGIVYYMRLNNYYRKKYSDYLDQTYRKPGEVLFTSAFDEELEWYINKVELPTGIARTRALKENIFATIVCTITRTPLIIVGAPGSSKTLSFNQTILNLKGAESRVDIFRDTSHFCSLDPYYYQCSRRTTSNEIQTVFTRAINRQKSNTHFNLSSNCVVFMDEAGLPEESHESLKVLHYHLDKQEVSFVAITNHVLDAAKTNRAVSLFRPEASDEDLETLAKGCFCSNPENPPAEMIEDLRIVVKFCKSYSTLMSNKAFSKFFGLRDFIQFVNYLHRKYDQKKSLSSQVVLQALERNFNGFEDFESICLSFLGADTKNVKYRSVIDILCASLQDRPQAKQELCENEVRYKLVIDPSEDDSLVRLLFTFGILDRENTKIFVCSNFPADSHLQKINTIAAIRHSATEGHTVVISQTDDIHESFYDLFNQRFRRIDDLKEGPRYYTNIAIGAHLRPSRVHPNFQCVEVVKKSEIVNTPAPFLNRFEKYLITHQTMLETALNQMPSSVSAMIKAAVDKVKEFISLVSSSESLYGLRPDTLNSLVISLLHSVGHVHTHKEMEEQTLVIKSSNIQFCIMQATLQALRDTGLLIPEIADEELNLDVNAVFEQVLLDPKFKGVMLNMTPSIAAQAISEAINKLNIDIGPDKGDHLYVSSEGCLVIALIQQWVVRHFCKRLMQLMTSEALILHRNKIPSSYLKNYLIFQNHFSLQKLIKSYHQAAASTKNDHPTCRSATKILCFTRSSPLIHQLPAEFPCSALGKEIEDRAKQTLKELVYVETDKLVSYKLSSIHSQTNIQTLITNFLESSEAEVCFLFVNMQETSKEIVNHLRIMIEEAEILCTYQITKLFVVLLHFPPTQFFQPCYPSLFLKGWDHCYLDTIAHSTVQGVVDIQDWFWQLCFSQQSSQLEQDTLVKALVDILPQAIPVLVSRVVFRSRQHGIFNGTMNGSQRTESLKDFLAKEGQDEVSVWQILCKKFREYWKPGVMTEELERAAAFSRNRESTLNMTESVQTRFKSLFLDFLVYIISQINKNCNIDTLLDPSSSNEAKELFFQILKVFPIPKLYQITPLSKNLHQPNQFDFVSNFPFFNLVFSIMENIVELSREEANAQMDLLGEPLSETSLISRIVVSGTLKEAVLKKISEDNSSKHVLELVGDAMSKEYELWNRYFNDFVLHKLQLDSEDSSGDIAQQILHTFLGQLHHLEALERIVSLHTYLHVYQLDMARIGTVLRPLNKLNELQKKMTSTLLSPKPSLSPTDTLLSTIKRTQHPLGSSEPLTNYVVTTLFDILQGIVSSTESSFSDNLKIWHKVYRDVMALPNLKSCIYSALEEFENKMSIVEAKLNFMQMIFLILQIGLEVEQGDDFVSKIHHVLKILMDRYFNEARELITDRLGLSAMTQVFFEVITSTGLLGSNSFSGSNEPARVILEGLLAHFFSPERQHYNSEDIRWFLSLANSQKGWGSGQLEDEFGVVSGNLSDDLSALLEESLCTTTTEFPEGVVGINVFKLYLGRILGQVDVRSSSVNSGPLQLYNQFSRNEIGVVLTTKTEIGPPGPYIPMFYSYIVDQGNKSQSSRCMQQPLANLYFLTVLEHLMSKPYKLSEFVRMAFDVSTDCKSESTSAAAKAVLYIEQQAVIQVIAQQLALHLDPYQPEKCKDVPFIINDLNELMNDPCTGGGTGGGHGTVVALHMFKLLKSSRKFTGQFTKMYGSIIKDCNILRPIYEQIEVRYQSCVHLLPFMRGANGEMASLYDNVRTVMTSIHEGVGSMDSLKQLAEKCSHMRDSFRMMVWLVTYYNFFLEKETSQSLCDAIGSPEMLPYLKEEGYVRMIQCLLFPDLMIHREEAPNVLRDGRHQPIKRCGNEMDPVYELFMPPNPEQQDQSDIDLCHCLANLVAIVMGCPSRSNHLWFHIFAPQELVNTYMTGFMYNSKISPDGLQYDCGVELTAEGEFGRSDYLKHAGRGTYTLHSLYLILWANFGAFTMSLLTLPDADTRIHGNLISKSQCIRHYCVSQLRAVWKFMRNNLVLSEEERSFFVNQCLHTFHEVVNGQQEVLHSSLTQQSSASVRDCVQGTFATCNELDDYERMWHLHIYQPTWNQLQEKPAELFNIWQNKLYTDIRCLDVYYPHFPSEVDFAHRIQCCGDLEQHSEGGELRVLSNFAQGWKLLQAGGLLLPDLVEFYQWLHTELAYLVTREKATTISILRVVETAAERYTKSVNILALYDRVKKGYNEYMKMTGGAMFKQRNMSLTFTDDIPLIFFLTDSEHEEETSDCLFTVISQIVGAHNHAIESLYAEIHSQGQLQLTRLLPDRPAKILSTEVSDETCIVGKFSSLHSVNNLVQIIRSRYQLFISQGPSTPSTAKFQLKYLEEDLVKMFYAGKPLIESLSSVHSTFKYKQTSNECGMLDLKEMGGRLSDEYQKPLSEGFRKRVELEFHSCIYSSLTEVITALRTVCDHLVKIRVNNTHLNLTLPGFMMTYVYEDLTNPYEVLTEIGITPNSLKHSQLACLIDMPILTVFACLELFVQWVDQGVYDFCNLPLVLKANLSEADLTFFEKDLIVQWTGTLKGLETEVKKMIEVLKHSEIDIVRRVTEHACTSRTSLRQYLSTDENQKLLPFIPVTVVLHHYVHVRLALQRLLMKLRAELEESSENRESQNSNPWSEFVVDLWSIRLKHIQKEPFGDKVVVDSTTGHYGFGSKSGSEGMEERLFDLENKGDEVKSRDSIVTVDLAKKDFVDTAVTKKSDIDQSTDKEESEIEKKAMKPTRTQAKKNVIKARSYTAQDVGDFLSSIKLDKYREAFISNGVRGDVLLEADSEFLTEIGVSSPLDCVRIMTLFPRQLQGDKPRFPISAMLRFLKENDFEKYTKTFKENQIDGDMLLDAGAELMKAALKEIGIGVVDRVKIFSMFNTFADDAENSS